MGNVRYGRSCCQAQARCETLHYNPLKMFIITWILEESWPRVQDSLPCMGHTIQKRIIKYLQSWRNGVKNTTFFNHLYLLYYKDNIYSRDGRKWSTRSSGLGSLMERNHDVAVVTRQWWNSCMQNTNITETLLRVHWVQMIIKSVLGYWHPYIHKYNMYAILDTLHPWDAKYNLICINRLV